MKVWTTPFHGVTHCGKLGDERWAVVSDQGGFVTLVKWWSGCDFLPGICEFDTVEQAKEAGEAWIERGC